MPPEVLSPSRRRRVVAGVSGLALAVTLVPAAAAVGSTAPSAPSVSPHAATDLIISEYIEGTSNNKALEFYNGTDATVDLTGYSVQVYANGSTSPGSTIALTGTVAPGAVHVLTHSSWALGGSADQTSGALNFNGNDAVTLLNDGVLIDSFGQVGDNPGTAWGSGDTSTVDNTLRRLSEVCSGDLVPDDPFEPALEYSGHGTNAVDGLGSHTTDCGAGGVEEPLLNEFSASTVGADVEYLEVIGLPDTDYSDLTVLQVEGDASASARGSVVSVHPMGETDENGYWLQELASNTLQNGTLTLLLVQDFTGEAGTVLDTDQDGVLDAELPFTQILDSVAVDTGEAGTLTYSPAVLSAEYDGLPFVPGGASRIPNGVSTDSASDWMRNDFDLFGIPGYDGSPIVGEAVNTPGAPNQAYQEEPLPPGGSCGDPATPIGTVQGEGFSTPIAGQVVTVEGVVIGDFQHTGSFGGFYVQDGGDDNPATSDGIWVPSTTAVEEGDLVRVTGTAGESFGLTQLGSSTVTVCDSGVDLPEPVELQLPMTDEVKEAHESMRVTLTQDLAILEYFNYGRFGEIVIGVDRQFQPTNVFEPGSEEAQALAAANLAERITLDDGLNVQNPSVTRHPNGEPFALDNYFRGGDLVSDATGVLDYRFSLWRIQPTAPAGFTAVNQRPEVPEVGGDTTVAAFNVLNYFTTLNSRGAVNPEEFERQEIKIVTAIAQLDADIVGLIEIENNDDEALATLTEALNDYLGADVYDYLATGTVGTDEITTAFIYQTDEVQTVGEFATLTEEQDPRFRTNYNRPVLAQTFQRVEGGELVTVANNHLKSKGSSCDAVGDPEDPDGQGNCNGVRTEAAEAMVDWLATDPTETGSENVVVIGDLNSYAKEDPIVALNDGGYVDLLAQYQGSYAYTYVFDGQLGYLDHALANPGAAELVTGAAAWYINADEASLLDYTTRFKPPGQAEIWAPDAFRSSDHDPVLVGMQLLEEPVEPVDPVDRIGGDDRYQVAANAALEVGPRDVVFLAGGEAFADALAAASPAAADQIPVLLTRSDRLPQVTGAALAELAPSAVVILGGEESVDATVAAAVATQTGADVLRIEGAHRYEVAAGLAAAYFEPEDVDVVVVASGTALADALAGGPLAGQWDSPILLTRGDVLPLATRAALTDLAPSQIVVLGGPDTVQQEILLELQQYADDVQRIAGDDRYSTAVAIAEQLEPSEHMMLASGTAFADALAASPVAGLRSAPILLTKAEEMPASTLEFVTDSEVTSATVVGGTISVTEAVEDALRELLSP